MTQVNSQTIKYSLAKDIGLLVKVKLSLTVLSGYTLEDGGKARKNEEHIKNQKTHGNKNKH